MVFRKLAQKLVKERQKQALAASNPFSDEKRVFLNKMTHSALNLYERKCDIKNFSKLVLSDPENLSHNAIMREQFSNGVKDPFADFEKLSENEKFWRDLGLD